MSVKDYRAQVEAHLAANASAAAAAPTSASGAAAGTTSPEQQWKDAFAVLADPNATAERRRNALQVLQAGTFLGHRFDSCRAQYTDALRKAVFDPELDVRHFALDILVGAKDAIARQHLTDGLQGKTGPLLPNAVALALLARDDHASASTIARDLLKSAADPATRAQAVRVLGSDPSAVDLLSGIMNDKNELRDVRRAGAVALKALDPQRFATDAAAILNDNADFDEIKSTVGGALAL